MQVRFTRYLLINFHVSSPNDIGEIVIYNLKEKKNPIYFKFTLKKPILARTFMLDTHKKKKIS